MGTPALECSVLATAAVYLGGRGTPAGVGAVSIRRGYSVWTPASPTPVNMGGGGITEIDYLSFALGIYSHLGSDDQLSLMRGVTFTVSRYEFY